MGELFLMNLVSDLIKCITYTPVYCNVQYEYCSVARHLFFLSRLSNVNSFL